MSHILAPPQAPVLTPGHDWADLDLTRSEARNWFLRIADRLEPTMLATLGTESYALFRAIPREIVPIWEQFIHHTLASLVILRLEPGKKLVQIPDYGRAFAWLRARAAELPIRLPEHAALLYRWMPFVEPGSPWPSEAIRLHESVSVWAGRWHIAEEWCIEQALWALSYWSSQEDLRIEQQLPLFQSHDLGKQLGWDLEIPQYLTYRRIPIGSHEQRFAFEHKGWDLIKITRAGAEQKLRAAFEEALSGYLDRMESLAATRGLVPVPQKRGTEHFEWLVRYQVQGRSFQAIARDACRDRKTVADAVRETAALLQLSLRPPGQPGRPSKFPMSRPVAACRK